MTIHHYPQAEVNSLKSGRSMPPSFRIEELRTRAAPLDMTGDKFRTLGHDLVDRIADFLTPVRTHPVTRAESPEQVRASLAANRTQPQEPRHPEALLRGGATPLSEHSLFNGHP